MKAIRKIKKYLIWKLNLKKRPWMKQSHARKKWRRDWGWLIRSWGKRNK